MSKLLVLGASGIIGRALLRQLGPERALATCNSRRLPGAIAFDALKADLPSTIPNLKDFSHAVILLAQTNFEACRLERERSWKLNVATPMKLARQLQGVGVVPVFASTESVFDGERGSYTESDAPRPIFEYARQKAEAERCIQEAGGDFLILRFAKVYGSERGDGSILTSCLESFLQGKPVYGAPDQIHSMIHADDLARSVVALCERGQTGIHHVGGPEPISRLDFLELFANEIPSRLRRGARVIPKSIREFNLAEPRPVNSSLDSSKLYHAAGMIPRNPRDMARAIASVLAREVA